MLSSPPVFFMLRRFFTENLQGAKFLVKHIKGQPGESVVIPWPYVPERLAQQLHLDISKSKKETINHGKEKPDGNPMSETTAAISYFTTRNGAIKPGKEKPAGNPMSETTAAISNCPTEKGGYKLWKRKA